MIKSKTRRPLLLFCIYFTALLFFSILGLCWWPFLCLSKHPLSFHQWLRSIHYVLGLTWSLLNAHLTKFYMTKLSQWVREQMASWPESMPALFHAFPSLPQRSHIETWGGNPNRNVPVQLCFQCSQLWSLGRHSSYLNAAETPTGILLPYD